MGIISSPRPQEAPWRPPSRGSDICSRFGSSREECLSRSNAAAMYDDVLSPRYTSRRMELWADFLTGSPDVKSSSFLTDFSPGDNASSRSQEGCEEHQEEAGMLTAGDGSAGGGCGSTGAPCCPGALSGSKWGVAESLSYQGAGMKLAGGCEETTEALCRARGGGSAEDEDKPMGQAAGGSSCSSGQEAWTPSADHALAGDNHKQLMRQGKSLACRWQAALARHEEAAAVATPKRPPHQAHRPRGGWRQWPRGGWSALVPSCACCWRRCQIISCFERAPRACWRAGGTWRRAARKRWLQRRGD